MADVAWSQNLNSSDNTYPVHSFVHEAVIDDTDTDTEILPLDTRKDVSFAIKASASTYTVDVLVYLENSSNATPISYTFVNEVGTSAGVDYVRSSIGPVAAIKFDANNAQASETATIQVLQMEKRSDQ